MNNQTVTSPESFGSGLIHKPEESSQVGGTPTRKQSFQRLQYLIRIARITLFYRMKLKKRASKKILELDYLEV